MNEDNCGFSSVNTKPKRARILIHGDAYTGKSTFGLSMPSPWVIDCDGGGTESLLENGALDIVTHEPLPWTAKHGQWMSRTFRTPFEVLQFLTEVGNKGWFFDNGGRFGSLVIDPITELWEMIQSDYDDKTGKTDKNAKDEERLYNKDKDSWKDMPKKTRAMNKIMNQIADGSVHVLYTAHSGADFVNESVVGYDGVRRNKLVVIGNKAKGAAKVEHKLDIILEFLSDKDPVKREYLKKHKDVRVLARVDKDRTHVFAKGELIPEPKFQLWDSYYLSPNRIADTRDTSINYNSTNHTSLEAAVFMCMENPEVRKLADVLGMSEEDLLEGVRARNGDLNLILEQLRGRANESTDV